jgi:hypothetical protein
MRFAALLPALLPAAALLTACEAGTTAPAIPPGDPPAASCTNTQSSLRLRRVGPSFDIADAQPNAAAGRAAFHITGDLARSVGARASAFEQARGPGADLTVVDAFAADAQGEPMGELFIFIASAATVDQISLNPVTLAQLHDTTFVPSRAIAVFAEQYDSTSKDYAHWLLARSGTVDITSVSDGQIGRVALAVSLSGTWVDPTGKTLGCGKIEDASIEGPLLRLSTGSDPLRDTLTAQLAGARSGMLASSDLTSFQVLNPSHPRLLVTGSAAPADSTMELWLSIPGIPGRADSIVLGATTLDEAVAGQADSSFGMLRVFPSGESSATQLWRSTSGYVTLTNIVQMGPLALCGWVSGRYAFDATGADLAADTALTGTLSASGAFESRFTALSPRDTLEGTAATSLAARFLRPSSPRRTSGATCAF